MRGKSLALTSIMVGCLTASLYTVQAQEVATIGVIPLEERVTVDDPVLLRYRLVQEEDNKQTNIGKVYVKKNSIEAELKGIFRVVFSQPTDSTYEEHVGLNLFGMFIGESYKYHRDKDSVWHFDAYHAPFLFSKEEKVQRVGMTFPREVMTQREILSSILQGSIMDTTRALVMAWNYGLEITSRREKYDGEFLEFKITDVHAEKNDSYYVKDPIKGVVDNNNIPVHALVPLTEVSYSWGRRKENIIFGKLILEYADTEKLLKAYGSTRLDE